MTRQPDTGLGSIEGVAWSVGKSGAMSMSRDATDRKRKIEALAEEVGPLAYGVAVKMLGDGPLAEDALQEAYLQAFRHMSGFRGESSMRTWFLRILVNSCRRHRVLMRRWMRHSTEPRLAARSEATHTDAHGDPALRARLDRAIVNLPHRQRTAFVLRYTKDLSIEEIAEIMGCARGTVKATIHKAVTRLRGELAGLDER
jgi:RNA polymerase sigma-70 factor (ECF subfamily)